jgi:ubiquinone/menaquinone biosynthesis C-methylase UbiE
MVDRIPLAQEPLSGMEVAAQYDKGAKLYMMPEYKYFVRKILRRGIRSGKVLDLGTGSGRLAIELANAKGCRFEIIALDISENMLERARENAREAGVENKIQFIFANASGLPFLGETFDLIISYASLHHWFQPVAVFNEAQRVIKKNGTVIIRDNQRVYGTPFWEAFIWIIYRFMNKRHRDNWPKAILASYTVSEIQDILKKSNLKNYHIGTDFIKFDLSIEVPEKPT